MNVTYLLISSSYNKILIKIHILYIFNYQIKQPTNAIWKWDCFIINVTS